MRELTPKQKKFCDEYLIDLNATQAAARAGYKDPNIGRQLITKNNVLNYIQKRLEERQQRTEITQDRVLQELANIGFYDVADYVRIEERDGINRVGQKVKYKSVELSPTEQIPRDKRAAIAGIKQGANGIEIKFSDKLRALELLGKHLGMFNTRDENNEEALSKLDRILFGINKVMDGD